MRADDAKLLRDFGLGHLSISELWSRPKRIQARVRDRSKRDRTNLLELEQFDIGEQHYWRVGERVCRTRAGREFKFLVWETECPTCRCLFTVITGTASRTGVNRRCQNCRKPGVPVERELARRRAKAIAEDPEAARYFAATEREKSAR